MTSVRPINHSSTIVMTSKDSFQPLRVLPKPIFIPFGLNRPKSKKIPLNIQLFKDQLLGDQLDSS